LLSWKEKMAISPKRPTDVPPVLAPRRLGAVLDQTQVVRLADRRDLLDTAGRAAHVDTEHRTRVRPDFALQVCRIDAEGLVDVDQTRDGAGADHRRDAADPQITGDHHLVAGADIERRHGDGQGRGSGRDAEGVLVAEGLAPFAL